LVPVKLLESVVTDDEHGKQIVEFTDLAKKIILKKIQLVADPDTRTGKGYYGWLCSYFTYDDLEQLRCVIQPRGVEMLSAGNWQFTSTLLNEQCFRYEYDNRGRLTMKKMPGAGTVYMIFDARDRLVMSQDSVMRAAHKWFYMGYDELNRAIASGLFSDTAHFNDVAYHRAAAANSTSFPSAGTY
jgi:hypothetical protein